MISRFYRLSKAYKGEKTVIKLTQKNLLGVVLLLFFLVFFFGFGLGMTQVKYKDLGRSEEHTSELQSRPHLVCRLLLEKKKTRPCRGQGAGAEPHRRCRTRTPACT